MNIKKRKDLEKTLLLLELSIDIIKSVKKEEQNGYYNMTEGLQQTKKGEMMDDAIDDMDEAIKSLEDAVMYIEDAMNGRY